MAHEELAGTYQIGKPPTPMGEDEDVASRLFDGPFDMNDEEEPPDLVYDEMSDNLMFAFVEHHDGREAAREIAAYVCDCYEQVAQATEERRERMRDDWSLFAGDLQEKQEPYQGAANCQVPVLPEQYARISSLIEAELFGDWTHFASIQGVGPDDTQLAETVELHDNWQFIYDIDDFPRQASRATMMFLWGDVSGYSYWDTVKERNHHRTLSPDEVYVPYTLTSTQPDYSDCNFVIWLRFFSRADLQAERGWHGVEKLLGRRPDAWDEDPEMLMAQGIAEAIGIETPEDDKQSPYKILHFEGWDNGLLPGQTRDRYIQCFVDLATRRVLKLRIHEAPDWKDKIRHRQQVAEAERYRADIDTYERAMALNLQGPSAPPAIAPMGLPPAGPEAVIPRRPDWMKNDFDTPEEPTLKPIRMFSHAVLFEPMHGTVGLGYLQGVAHYHRAAATALSQFTDAASMANAWVLLTAAGVELPDDFSFAPGRVHQVPGASAAGGELEAGIRELKPPAANPQLVEIVRMMREFSQGHMSSNPVLSGASGKSGETFRGLSMRHEAATKELSVRARKLSHNYFRQILRNNHKLNAVYLPEGEMVRLWDWKIGQMRDVRVERRMYERDYNITMRTDLKFSTEAARVQEAMELVQLSNQDPVLATNQAFRYAATRKLLEARGHFDMIHMLGAPPPPPQVYGPPPPQPGEEPEGAEPPQGPPQ